MVIIIGAGLAGLTCAKILQENGVEFQLIEAGDNVGGRLKTTVTQEGFRLDHGFQVLLENYPAVRRHIDIEALDPCYFDSGAILAAGQKMTCVRNPLRHLSGIFESATGRYATLSDKFLLGKLAGELAVATPEKLLKQDRLRVSTMQFLEKRGFSRYIIESFFRPFFGGVLLDNALSTSASLFQYYFQKFILGRTMIPKLGIQEIPKQLSAHISKDKLILKTSVSRITNDRVFLETGDSISARKIVLATNAPNAARLLACKPPPPPRSVSVCYFSSEAPLYPDKLLVLPAGKERLVRHFAQVTNIAPSLAPDGRHLLSATVLQQTSRSHEALLESALSEIAEIFPDASRFLTPLCVIDVPYAVPAQPPRYSLQRNISSPFQNVILAGDHTLHGSVQGAMESGERAAQNAMKLA